MIGHGDPLALYAVLPQSSFFFFFFSDTASTEISTLSLHDALPISRGTSPTPESSTCSRPRRRRAGCSARSEEHTSELQSLTNLVCRLLLEKKKNTTVPKGTKNSF